MAARPLEGVGRAGAPSVGLTIRRARREPRPVGDGDAVGLGDRSDRVHSVLRTAVVGDGRRILIAVDALPDLFATTLNVTGDLAAAAIVAKGRVTDPALAVAT